MLHGRIYSEIDPMNIRAMVQKPPSATIRFMLGIVGLLALALLFSWQYTRQSYPHLHLRDGSDFRVVKITYTAQASDSTDHNIGASRFRWWLWRHLPSELQNRMATPGYGIGNQASDHPAISIWWAWINPNTQIPDLGPSGDVILTTDSGHQQNLGWPDPADDGTPSGPAYRQIFVTDPPTDSPHLTFDVPVEEEIVHFTIKNPAYRQ